MVDEELDFRPYRLHFMLFASPAYKKRMDVSVKSILEHHPNAMVHTFDVDSEAKPGTYVEDLARVRLQMVYDLLQKSDGNDYVVLMGSDCVLYSPLNKFIWQTTHHAITLTPHVITPPTERGAQLYMTGHVNADLIGFSKAALPILEWLLKQKMVNDTHNGIFYEQTWLSILPFVFDDVAICKDPGINLAYFNLHERMITLEDGRYYVNGSPLVMFQFSGFEEEHPERLSKYYDKKYLNPVASMLALQYAKDIK